MHKKYLPAILAILAFSLITPTAHAEPDILHGKQLHEKSCQQCHDDSIYTRADSIIFSLKALDNRVHFCERMARAGWTEKDIGDVIGYLNDAFYKFDQKN